MSDRLESWRRSGDHVGFRGEPIFYRAEPADGRPTLVLVHGFPTSSFDWRAVWASLAARFRLVAMDLLGFGFSSKPRYTRYSIMTQADVVEAVARHLGIAEAHLLAHDYGDTVAQELLARHEQGGPLRIQSACLLNGGLFPETHRPRPVQRLLASPIGGLVPRLMDEGRFARGFGAIFGPKTKPTPEEMREYWAVVRERDGHLLADKLIGYMKERREQRERWVGPLVRRVVPVRVVDGLVDPVSGIHMVERYRELVPQPDVVELEGIGHYPQVEAPDAVVEAVLAFHERLVRVSG